MNAIIAKIHFEKNEEKKAGLLYNAAEYYLETEGSLKKDLDSAGLLNGQSVKISRELGLKSNVAKSMLLNSRIANEKGNSTAARNLCRAALDYALSNNLKNEAASIYVTSAVDIEDNENLKKAEDLKKAAVLYKQAGALYDEAETFNQISILYNSIDEPGISNKYALQAISIKKSIKRHDLYKEYTMLGLNLRVQGKYKEALAYALAAEKITENIKIKDDWLSIIYDLTGTIYSEMKFYDKSVDYYKKAIEVAKRGNDEVGINAITINTARGLLSRDKYDEALSILNNVPKYYHTKDCNTEYASIFILIYCKLKKYDKAKPYYDHLVKCNDVNNGIFKDHIGQEKVYYAMIYYLINTGQAGKTYQYINELNTLAKKNNDLLNLSQLEKVRFEADSATGNYLSAISHLKEHKLLNDSLYNINSRRQFANLQLKYETDKKDKNIKMLTQQGKLQEARIYNDTVLRYVFIGSLVALILFTGLLYNRFRLKQRSNSKLQLKQEKINVQNGLLKRLLTEKEWLLKEIHHRVKNNLQIVISLLNTQSAYLDNEDALMAIQNSQHRMHAMSLIHQKLYQSNNLASIDMSWYIYELVNYLKDCFDTTRKVNFILDTDKVDLDVAQAVPLGLILNEAISNAIKYAFPDNARGIVTIKLKKTDESTYQLIIADDGIGLPVDFELENRDSLGMNLMIGLSEQLDGSFSIENNKGLHVIITFIKNKKLMGSDDNPLNVKDN
ncbi:histidine kinase dimerization/phosphoacceptor domain -containing protein [Flavobacterium rivuli]|uniref:histidine kinase dimerization/phosphoacceptor domain -containing protein n=1 Tax=Flavobacterium rivuli TaxID=498301 RepID=UPI0003A27483|nr:histidine kinase dimerization/phosphoacceptor domain -containing protein [Flavobacterium rivuli]